VIGNEGGFIPKAQAIDQIILGPAERVDVELDFTKFINQSIVLQNIGPDGGYGDGAFDPANPDTTGQIIRFDVIKPAINDPSSAPGDLILPPINSFNYSNAPLRGVSVTNYDSSTVNVNYSDNGKVINLDCSSATTMEMVGANLGKYVGDPAIDGVNTPLKWSDPVSETPKQGQVEIWEIVNLTEDAHPFHIHQGAFQVLSRMPFGDANHTRSPDVWEQGFKDTIISYPDEQTRIVVRFDIAGQFVWHCHLLEHEDNELMRPLVVVAP